MNKDKYKSLRLSNEEIMIVEKEINNKNNNIKNFSDFYREAVNAYFENKKLKQEIKDLEKLKYVDEKTSMMLLMLADVVSIQLAYDDEKRIKYISEIHEELVSKIRFNQKLY